MGLAVSHDLHWGRYSALISSHSAVAVERSHVLCGRCTVAVVGEAVPHDPYGAPHHFASRQRRTCFHLALSQDHQCSPHSGAVGRSTSVHVMRGSGPVHVGGRPPVVPECWLWEMLQCCHRGEVVLQVCLNRRL